MNLPDIELLTNPSNGSRVVTGGQIDGQMVKITSEFCLLFVVNSSRMDIMRKYTV
jgi:hypothetical protein